MRKILLIISLLAVFSVSGTAQFKPIRFGLKMGPSIDWASSGSTAANNEGVRLGGNIGLVCEQYFTSNFAFASGLSLNYLNMKYTFTDRRYVDDFLEETNVAVERRLKATNLEIPLKAKAKFGVSDSFSTFVEAGFGLSFNLRDQAKDEYSFYWVAYEDEAYRDCTNQYRLMQASLLFGLGAEYEINDSMSAFAQLTFDHCFSNAFVRSLEKKTGSVLRNNYVGLEVGIML